jgi:hypothetical protein
MKEEKKKVVTIKCFLCEESLGKSHLLGGARDRLWFHLETDHPEWVVQERENRRYQLPHDLSKI